VRSAQRRQPLWPGCWPARHWPATAHVATDGRPPADPPAGGRPDDRRMTAVPVNASPFPGRRQPPGPAAAQRCCRCGRDGRDTRRAGRPDPGHIVSQDYHRVHRPGRPDSTCSATGISQRSGSGSYPPTRHDVLDRLLTAFSVRASASHQAHSGARTVSAVPASPRSAASGSQLPRPGIARKDDNGSAA